MRELSIATWNCFGQGQGFVDAVTAWRAPHAARLHDDEVKTTLGEPHLVCVQEVLSRDAETFFDGLGTLRVRDTNEAHLRTATMRGSGLGIAGRLPLDTFTIEPFATSAVGWDRLARKGTLHARVRVQGLEVDVLTGHLQSGYDAASIRVRAQQIAELARRVEQLGSEERPFIISGDFNVCGLSGGRDEYAMLRRALPAFEDLGAGDDLPTFDPHPERNSLAHEVEPGVPAQRIDYLLVRSPRRGARVRARHVRRILDRPLRAHHPSRGKHAFASDHFGLVAHLAIDD